VDFRVRNCFFRRVRQQTDDRGQIALGTQRETSEEEQNYLRRLMHDRKYKSPEWGRP
jgi:hypothetical protein